MRDRTRSARAVPASPACCSHEPGVLVLGGGAGEDEGLRVSVLPARLSPLMSATDGRRDHVYCTDNAWRLPIEHMWRTILPHDPWSG